MPEIKIKIRDKRAGGTGTVICGNSDYTVVWDLDDEWAPYSAKTMRVNLADGTYQDVVFSGDSAALPVLSTPGWASVGLYAGDLHTSRAADLRVLPSVTTPGGTPADPPESVYDQLMELIRDMGGASEEDIAKVVAAYLTEHPVEETDPTVPAWAKEDSKPTYTAAEVGALSADTLQAAANAALAQAKASGVFDGADGDTGPQGPKGDTGDTGPQGPQGDPGTNGFSPTIEATETTDGVAITISNRSGQTHTKVKNGTNGQDGKSINWQGEYKGNTLYNPLDAVSYEGSVYIAASSAIGAIPGIDEEVWSLMAEKGNNGEPGIVISSTQPTGDTHPVWLNPAGGPSGDTQPSIWDAATRSGAQSGAYSNASTGRDFAVDKYYYLYSYSGTTQSPANGTMTDFAAGAGTLEFKVNAAGATASQLSGYGVVVPLELEVGKSYIFGAKCASANSSVYLITYTLSDGTWTYSGNSRICYSTADYCSAIIAPEEGKGYAVCFAQKAAGVGTKNIFSQISLRETKIGVPLLQIWDASSLEYTPLPAIKGPKGDTPVKGTDYWTAADKAAIVADVLAALPDGTEVSY